MNALAARKCCCEPGELPNCDGFAWADAPDQISVAVSVTWQAITCASETPQTTVGCPQAGYPNDTVYYENYQTVTHTLIGVLHKGPENLWPGTMYVGNDPALVAASDSTAPLSWSVDVSGSGQRLRRVAVTIPPSPTFYCFEAVDFSPTHGDGGTLYPAVHLGCVSGYESSCQTIPVVPSRPVLTIGKLSPSDLSNTANSSSQWPLNVVFPGQTSAFPPSDTLDAQEIAWPPIIPECPPGTQCDGCGTTLISGQFGTCWSCRTTCVPRRWTTAYSFLSPIGYPTQFVSDSSSISGPYRLGLVNGGLCVRCDDGVSLLSCSEFNEVTGCTADPSSTGHRTDSVSYGTAVITA
jgi:hypothetical protein